MKKNFLLIIIFFCVLSNSIKAQVPTIDQSFRPIFSVGLAGAQMDGDTYSGYKKIGYFFGLGINRQLSRTFELEFAITMIQKGVRSNWKLDSATRNSLNNTFVLIRLNYLEIPVCLKINYKHFKAEVGGAFGYLIKNPPYDESQNGMVIDNGYKNVDYSFLLGLGYKLSPNLFLNVRFEYSLTPVRPYPAVTGGVYRGIFGGLFNKGIYNNILQLTLNYRLPSRPSSSTAPPINAQ